MAIPAGDLAVEAGSPKASNIVMLGAYVTDTGILTKEEALAAIGEKLGKKQEMMQINRAAFEAGVKFAESRP